MVLHFFLEGLAIACALAALPLVAELLLLSLAALIPRGESVGSEPSGDQRLAVVVPAHNEELLITSCVRSVLTSGVQPFAVYVVAHNCTDSTPAHAQEAGATVLPLNDGGADGKGAALRFGFQRALDDGGTAVMVVDADSVITSHLVGDTVAVLRRGADAVQCRYVFSEVSTPSPRSRLMALALIGTNVVRPLGRHRLGLSCGIFGNGFTLTAETLKAVPYTASSVVEDVEYHLTLVRSGRRVEFLETASVFSEMPDSSAAASTQRARWQGGRSRMRRVYAPALLGDVLRGRLRMLEPLLDLLALPTATGAGLLLLLLLLPFSLSRIFGTVGVLAFALHLCVAARMSDSPRDMATALLALPKFFLHKIAMMPATRRAAGDRSEWVRTERNQGKPK